MPHPLEDWLSPLALPLPRSQALAALGVLAAEGARSAGKAPRDVFEALAREPGSPVTDWRMPSARAVARGLPDPAGLAAAWAAALDAIGDPAQPRSRLGPTRLLLHPRGRDWTADEAADLSWLIDTLLAQLFAAGHPGPWTQVPPARVGSAALLRRDQTPYPLAWDWPVRIHDDAIDWAAFGPALRGLARPGWAGRPAEIAA